MGENILLNIGVFKLVGCQIFMDVKILGSKKFGIKFLSVKMVEFFYIFNFFGNFDLLDTLQSVIQ